METCCDYCAQMLTSKNCTKFKFPLCKSDHVIPESKLYPLNKFALGILNVKLVKNFERPNYFKDKAILEEKIAHLEKNIEEFREELKGFFCFFYKF